MENNHAIFLGSTNDLNLDRGKGSKRGGVVVGCLASDLLRGAAPMRVLLSGRMADT